MFGKKIYIPAIMLLAIALIIASCGGSSNIGTMSPEQIDDSRTTNGVTLGEFEVLRYNTGGSPDPSLNNTIELSLKGDSLVISVEDGGVNGVAVDVKYDNTSVHPGSVEFSGLLGTAEEVLSASFTKNSGLVGIASAPIGGADLGAFSGEYATIAFPAGAVHSVSAIGDLHHGIVGQTGLGSANLFGEGDPMASTASVSWTTAFHTADGDQNSETGLSDLTVIALFFGQSTGTNWAAAVADYDENTEVGMSDISKIAIFFGEATSGYTVSFADDDGAGKVAFPGGLIDWGTNVTPAGPPVNGDFRSVFDTWTLDINAGTAFNYDALAAFDVNKNGFVNCYVANALYSGTPPVVSQGGVESTVLVPVGIPGPTSVNVHIDGYEVDVVAGTSTVGILTGDSAASLIANETVDFSLVNVIGKYQGEFFDKDTLPTSGTGDDAVTMTQENYDDIFAACIERLNWQFSDTGAPEIRRTASWTTHTSGSGANPGGGTVFPDDDPQSDDTLPEGLLVTSLPIGGQGLYPWSDTGIQVSVLANIDYDLIFDITPDPLATILSNFSTVEFELVVENAFTAEVAFGTGGAPGDLTNTLMQVVPIQGSGWAYDPGDQAWVDMVFADINPELGEFTIMDAGEGNYILLAKVNGADLQSGTEYAVRVRVEGVWSSINKPDPTIGTREFQAPEVVVLPPVCGPDVTELQLFPSDPKVRRNGEMSFDLISGVPVFEDEPAFNDVLKDSVAPDAEFPIEYNSATFETFPRIVVVPGGSPSVITGPEDPNRLPSANIITRQGNKLYVDIAAVPRPTGPGEPNTEYAFRIFTKDGSAFGEGVFECTFFAFGFEDPIAIDWSVNLWDRVEGSVDDIVPLSLHDAAGSILDGTTVGTATPDVLWFEFSGGWVFEGAVFDPVRIRADEVPAGDQAPINMRIEIAGLAPGDHYLGFHTVILADFFSIGNPAGLFRNGGVYQFTPYDALAAMPSDSYTRLMTVSGHPF